MKIEYFKKISCVTIWPLKNVFIVSLYFDWDHDKLFSFQYRKNGTDWQYYDTSVNGQNTSCIIRKLEPNTTYSFRISARNEMGETVSNESHPVTTLATGSYYWNKNCSGVFKKFTSPRSFYSRSKFHSGSIDQRHRSEFHQHSLVLSASRVA